MTWEQAGQVVGWVGLIASAFSAIVLGIRSLIKGPREERAIDVDIQTRVTNLAGTWLEKAEVRLEQAEALADEANTRAEKAEDKADELSKRVGELERNLFSALDTIGVLWPWGKGGGKPPDPRLPAWIFEWLHNQSKGL